MNAALNPDSPPGDLSDAELEAALRTAHGALPRALLDEAARREAVFVPWAGEFLAEPEHWGPDADEATDWALTHCICLLGASDAPEATEPLLAAFRHLDDPEHADRLELTLGGWPKLFGERLPQALPALEAILADRQRGYLIRTEALTCILAGARRAGTEALEAAINRAVAMVCDEDEDPEFRHFAAYSVLELPRARHRQTLLSLAENEPELFYEHFAAQELERAFREGDQPEWEHIDPWLHYDRQAIAAREAENRAQWHALDSLLAARRGGGEAYVRPGPKIGRNDPCPCGSGKKYKKCCLGKDA